MDKQVSLRSDQPIRVSVSEAARLFGVNTRTIRRALRQQKLRYIVVRNRYKILFSSLVDWSQTSSALQTKRDRQGIGQWIDKWKIRNTLYSPRPPRDKNEDIGVSNSRRKTADT